MQFERLAREVFVQPLVAVDAGDRIRPHRFDIVEIVQHGGMAFDRLQQIGEAAEHMGANRLALIRARHPNDLVGGNAEMVRPEPHQPLDKADLGAGSGIEARLRLV